LTLPGLYAVLDAAVAAAHDWTLDALAAALLDGGTRLLQIRAKTMPAGALLQVAERIVQAADRHGALVVVNDRPDIARLAGAAGVHVGQDDLPPDAARRVVGDSALVGWSTHTREQIAAVSTVPVSYVAVGPVFGTRTKDTGYEAVGLDLVREAASTRLPVVAIGGITLDRVEAVIAAGASSVAVISDLFTGGDPAVRARAFVRRLEEAGAGL
jgi:thiamine-phosphate pyrophosphorylase